MARKPKLTEEQLAFAEAKDFVPVANIADDHAVLNDGTVVFYISVKAEDVMLMSRVQRKIIIDSFDEGFTMLRGDFETLSIPRNVNLEQHINDLKQMMQETDTAAKRSNIRDQLEEAQTMVANSAVSDREHYILLSGKDISYEFIVRTMREQVKDFISYMRHTGREVELARHDQILGIFSRFAKPQQTAFLPSNMPLTMMPRYASEEH